MARFGTEALSADLGLGSQGDLIFMTEQQPLISPPPSFFLTLQVFVGVYDWQPYQPELLVLNSDQGPQPLEEDSDRLQIIPVLSSPAAIGGKSKCGLFHSCP